MAEINHALRGHVTQIAFNLSLGQTHIAALVFITESLAAGDREWIDSRQASVMRRTFGLFAGGAAGLLKRGLVAHDSIASSKPVTQSKFSECWRLTRAGELVVELLKESGIYQEYAGALPAPAEATWKAS